MTIHDNGVVTIEGCALGYLFAHNGAAFSPNGKIGELTPAQIDAHNAALDRLTIAHLDASRIGDRGTLYAERIPIGKANVKTWLGETVAVGRVNGNVLTFHRRNANGTLAAYRGTLRKSADCFTYRRVR